MVTYAKVDLKFKALQVASRFWTNMGLELLKGFLVHGRKKQIGISVQRVLQWCLPAPHLACTSSCVFMHTHNLASVIIHCICMHTCIKHTQMSLLTKAKRRANSTLSDSKIYSTSLVSIFFFVGMLCIHHRRNFCFFVTTRGPLQRP
jgi:hypothetical protein